MSNESQYARVTRPSPGEPRQRRLPKRFYKSAAVASSEQGFGIALDGRPVRTPARNTLSVPSARLGEAIAAEWARQGELIDPLTMPLTRLANSAIDGVRGRVAEVIDDIVAYAASDLICYRADGPQELIALQSQAWDPVLAWAGDDLQARFVLGQGVMPVDQPAATLERVREAFVLLEPFALAAAHVMTTLTGSALLVLAHMRGRLTLEQCWSAAHVDERFQCARWGEDADAAARQGARRAEFDAAGRFLALLQTARLR